MKSQPKRAFHTASEPEIKAGEVSDVYFDRTVEILHAKGLNKHVKAEVRLKSFPQPDWTFGVLAGIEEAAGLLCAHVEFDGDHAKLTVTGKGNKQRTVYLAGAGAQALAEQVSWRFGVESVFKLSQEGVAKAIVRLGAKAGLELSCHDLRRTYASRALDAGVDLVTVQKTMGHADPRTTARYDRRSDRVKRGAATALALG